MGGSASRTTPGAAAPGAVGTLGAMSPLRYRCTACGNLTRFDVTISRRTTAFHHYSVGGELTVEDEQVLEETVDKVECRWCGTGSAVVAHDEVAG